MEERSVPEKLSNMKSVGKVFHKGWAGGCSIACWEDKGIHKMLCIEEYIKYSGNYIGIYILLIYIFHLICSL